MWTTPLARRGPTVTRMSVRSSGDMDDYRDPLRKLTLRDEALIAALLANEPDHREPDLDAKTHALVRLSATVAVDAGQASFEHVVERAIAAGAAADEIVGTLVGVFPWGGAPRAVAGAPRLALALVYDVAAALEGCEGRINQMG